MNRLNSIALLAGGVLVAVAATGCASNSPKSAASGAPSTGTTSQPGGDPASGSTAASSSAPAGGSFTAPNSGASSSAAPDGSTTSPAAVTQYPTCANANLNVSLAAAVPGQKSSVFVIAVKNAGQTCTVGPIPYVWITKSPTDASDETRPLIPGVDTGKKNVILTGTTLYAAVDLLPGALATTTGNYGDLAVTANPSPDTSGKDVQEIVLPGPMAEGGAMLGVYAGDPNLAISQIQYATTPEK